MATRNGHRSTPAKPAEKPKEVVETRHVLGLTDREQEGFQKETRKIQEVRAKLEEVARLQQLVPQLQAEYANLEGRIQGRAQLALEGRGIDPDEASWSMTINEDRVSITYMAPQGAPKPEAQEVKA